MPTTLTAASAVGSATERLHVGLRGEVEDDLGPPALEAVGERSRTSTNVQRGALGDVLAPAGAEVVDDDDLVAALDERSASVRSDEPAPTGDDGPHRPVSYAAHVRHLRGHRRVRQDDAGRAARGGAAAEGDEVVATREPGGTPLGEADPRARAARAGDDALGRGGALRGGARASTSRSVIRPALAAGRVGGLRPLRRLVARLPGRRARRSALDAVLELNLAAVGGLAARPDLPRSARRGGRRSPGAATGATGSSARTPARPAWSTAATASSPRASRSGTSSSTGALPVSCRDSRRRSIREPPSLTSPSSTRRSGCSMPRSTRAGARLPLPRAARRRQARGSRARSPRVLRRGASTGGRTPTLRVVEALGEMIRIDAIRELHHDLHMRPFEADRRVYLIFERRPDERRRGRRAAEGPRGAAGLRGDRARRRRARADQRDDPLALPARPVPAALASRRCATRSRRAHPSSTSAATRRSHASRPAGSTGLGRLLDPKRGEPPRRRCCAQRARRIRTRRSSRPAPRPRCSRAHARAARRRGSARRSWCRRSS